MEKPAQMRFANLLSGAVVGAVLMYLLDEQQGRRRMAVARNRLLHWAKCGRELADVGTRDLGNRVAGMVARLRRRLQPSEPGNDVLAERVRAQLGRLVSHPHAVRVAVNAGRVILSGPVLQAEQRQLLSGVKAVSGVYEVENRLDVHETDGRLPALQGGPIQPAHRMEFFQENWAPGPRLVAFVAGTSLVGAGMVRRDLAGSLVALAGFGLAARATTNIAIGRLLGITGGRRGLHVQKAITIAAPREGVFELWSNYDNFPRFMSFVEAVRRIDDIRSHWRVKGPAGTCFEWDSVITQFRRPEILAWRSTPDAAVQHEGSVRFDEVEGGTRVSISMSYNLPGGAVAHSLAALLGRDPKQEIDADLMRMKSFIETGVPPHDCGRTAHAAEHRLKGGAVRLL